MSRKEAPCAKENMHKESGIDFLLVTSKENRNLGYLKEVILKVKKMLKVEGKRKGK